MNRPAPNLTPEVTHMTARELLAELKLSRSKLSELVATRAIPHVHFGRAIRFPRAEVVRWLAELANGR